MADIWPAVGIMPRVAKLPFSARTNYDGGWANVESASAQMDSRSLPGDSSKLVVAWRTEQGMGALGIPSRGSQCRICIRQSATAGWKRAWGVAALCIVHNLLPRCNPSCRFSLTNETQTGTLENDRHRRSVEARSRMKTRPTLRKPSLEPEWMHLNPGNTVDPTQRPLDLHR
ncbi:hypothetical protein PMIN07_002339 [Paraphaeosphaeria minitans]|uniref:Uncharacterized protein n=1 Tax=Paraphaeosphaeria minitans TaxID=565426 RepID=A0A9P6G642_9PLEO|nr:hypothetical protein PMIN01_12840 [Paraphaeosphaeria minitans]